MNDTNKRNLTQNPHYYLGIIMGLEDDQKKVWKNTKRVRKIIENQCKNWTPNTSEEMD